MRATTLLVLVAALTGCEEREAFLKGVAGGVDRYCYASEALRLEWRKSLSMYLRPNQKVEITCTGDDSVAALGLRG